MPTARRVVLAPPGRWPEARLLDATRALPEAPGAVRPGDAWGDLVVLAVDPMPGSEAASWTEIEVRARPRGARGPLADVAVLLDVSESMGLPWSADLTRAEAARESLAHFLREGARNVGDVAVFAYARDARLLAPPAPVRSVKDVDAPAPRGAARLAGALDAVLEHLVAQGREGRSQAILLLTDGVSEEARLAGSAHRAANLGVPVHIVVFAPETDALLDQLAETSGGSIQRASLPLTIDFIHEPPEDSA